MSTIRVSAFSDSHGDFPRVQPCDLLLIAGDAERDFSGPGNPMNGHSQVNWVNREFRDWVNTVQAGEVVMTPGNHSFAWQRLRRNVDEESLRCHVLIDSGIELFGLKIWGTPWVRDCQGWAFNLTEEQLEARWALIPDDTDILIVHTPPYEIDEWRGRNPKEFPIHGSETLLKAIERVKPKLVVCGHLHDAKGEWTVGETTIVNVSVKNMRYQMAYPVYTTRLDVPAVPAAVVA